MWNQIGGHESQLKAVFLGTNTGSAALSYIGEPHFPHMKNEDYNKKPPQTVVWYSRAKPLEVFRVCGLAPGKCPGLAKRMGVPVTALTIWLEKTSSHRLFSSMHPRKAGPHIPPH